jgi:hypothetical protein
MIDPQRVTRSAIKPHIFEAKALCPRPPVGSANFSNGARALIELRPAVNHGTHLHAKPQFSRRSRDDAADLGAGEPLVHDVSPKRLLGSGACGLRKVFLK